MADLKLVYAVPTEETALSELELFKDKRGFKYPKIYKSWHDNWATLSTCYKYSEEVRHLVYTTNAIEGFNRQLRKVTKTKRFFHRMTDFKKCCIWRLYISLKMDRSQARSKTNLFSVRNLF